MDDIPSLKDLCEHVTPQYSADWKVMGILLGVPFGTLRIVETENPGDNKSCCDQILKRWQEDNDSPSWNKFFAAIDLPLSFSNCHSINKGTSTVAFYSYEHVITTKDVMIYIYIYIHTLIVH